MANDTRFLTSGSKQDILVIKQCNNVLSVVQVQNTKDTLRK